MKTNHYFLLIFMAISYSSIGQGLIFEFQTEYAFNDLKASGGENLKEEHKSSDNAINFNFGISGNIYKNFFIKTKLGTNNMKEYIDYSWKEDGKRYELGGWYNINQNVAEVLAEYRRGTDGQFFLNTGFGLNQITYTDATFDHYVLSGSTRLPQPDFEGESFYWVGNIGAILMYKNLGFITGIGFRISDFTRSLRNPIQIGFNQFNFKMGMMYKL